MTSPASGIHIPGGCILIARKMLDSDLMDHSPLTVKLWVWMLLKANWQDRQQLSRGQFVTTIAEMQEAMSHYAGWRKITPTKDEIRNCYESLSRATRITTRKTTRGMVISIINYDSYQNINAYAAHTEDLKDYGTKAPATPQDTEEVNKKRNTYSDCFEELWKIYPSKDGKKAALRHFTATVKSEADCQRIRKALDNYLDHLKAEAWKKPKNGATWFNNWPDWENWTPATDQADEDLFKGVR